MRTLSSVAARLLAAVATLLGANAVIATWVGYDARMAASSMRHERELRIIAGQWRGRRLQFPEGPIRPTPDRVRETLFNWLQHGTRGLRGARCLDLYAGSGALGLEALSRGAAQAVFVEREQAAVRALRTLIADWGASGTEVLHIEARRYLGGKPSMPFDVVFLDPPFAADELAPAAARLDAGWLAPGARIYVEHAVREALPPLPQHWRELRSGRAGEVGYHLFQTAIEPIATEHLENP